MDYFTTSMIAGIMLGGYAALSAIAEVFFWNEE